jgi:hypothetical protein
MASNPVKPAEVTPTAQTTRKKRAQGDVVALTVRLSRSQWENMHSLAVNERISLQDLTVGAIADRFAKRGLTF